MDVKKLALLIGALVMAGISAFMARSLFTGSAAPSASAQVAAVPLGPEVLVATRPLPIGTIIGPESFRYQPWPKELVEKAYYIKGTDGFDPATLQGTVVRTEVTAGQPITQGSLVKPGDRGFLAAALGPGMRAVTVPVSTQSSVAGFIFPGDRVDLMLTQDVTGGGDGPPLKATETIVRNLRVLATDQTHRQDHRRGTARPSVKTFSTRDHGVHAQDRREDRGRPVDRFSSRCRCVSIADNNAGTREARSPAGEVTVPSTATIPRPRSQLLLAGRLADRSTATPPSQPAAMSRASSARTVPAREASMAPAAGNTWQPPGRWSPLRPPGAAWR